MLLIAANCIKEGTFILPLRKSDMFQVRLIHPSLEGIQNQAILSL